MRSRSITIATIVSAATIVSILLLREPLLRTVRANHMAGEKYLFVWAGDQARINPDFLAVVDFDERSKGYGNVLTTVPLPNPGATGKNRTMSHSLSMARFSQPLGRRAPVVPRWERSLARRQGRSGPVPSRFVH